jgi:hypothetical protein
MNLVGCVPLVSCCVREQAYASAEDLLLAADRRLGITLILVVAKFAVAHAPNFPLHPTI